MCAAFVPCVLVACVRLCLCVRSCCVVLCCAAMCVLGGCGFSVACVGAVSVCRTYTQTGRHCALSSPSRHRRCASIPVAASHTAACELVCLCGRRGLRLDNQCHVLCCAVLCCVELSSRHTALPTCVSLQSRHTTMHPTRSTERSIQTLLCCTSLSTALRTVAAVQCRSTRCGPLTVDSVGCSALCATRCSWRPSALRFSAADRFTRPAVGSARECCCRCAGGAPTPVAAVRPRPSCVE